MIHWLSLWLYNVVLRAYGWAICLAALGGNGKAKQWLAGRKNIFFKMRSTPISPNEKRIWIHCASLGEFEQGRPIIEALKKQYPTRKIVLTFFSPSGYEIRKNYTLADAVYYLPLDTAYNARQFIEWVQPDLAIFIKYEFWYHYLHTLQQQQVPTIVVSAIFRKNQLFFKKYGRLFSDVLKGVSHFFVQNDPSVQLLKSIGIEQVTQIKDTRFDRVVAHAQQVRAIPLVAAFKANRQLLVAGSTWQADETILTQVINQSSDNQCFVIAPHEISESGLRHLEQQISVKNIRFSAADIATVSAAKVLIIDNIGMLSAIYQYGDWAYIGGGFGKGIHNILEAAVFGLPVLFGPNYTKFQEARDLVDLGGAFAVTNGSDLMERLGLLDLELAGGLCRGYVFGNVGGTGVVMGWVENCLI